MQKNKIMKLSTILLSAIVASSLCFESFFVDNSTCEAVVRKVVRRKVVTNRTYNQTQIEQNTDNDFFENNSDNIVEEINTLKNIAWLDQDDKNLLECIIERLNNMSMRYDKKKNRVTIVGKKLRTLPTPLKIPSIISECKTSFTLALIKAVLVSSVK